MDRKTPSYIEKVLNLWAIILILWSLYRAYFKTDLPLWFDEIVAKPMIFVLPVYFFIKRFEKGDFFSSIYLKSTKRTDFLIGIIIGFLFLAAVFIGNRLHGSLKPFSLNKATQGMNIFALLGLAFMTSLSEEILSRGFVLKRLYEASKNIYSSSFFASILFFFLHIPILFTSKSITGVLLLKVMFTDLILSLAVSLIFLERKSLIIPLFIHTFYNLGLYFLI